MSRVNRELLREVIDRGDPLTNVLNRCTGTTTAIALRTLAQAIEQPGKAHKIADHEQTQLAHRYLQHQMMCIVDELGLKGFTFNIAACIVTCNFSEEIA